MTEVPTHSVLAGQRLVVVDVEGNGQQPPEIVELAAATITDGELRKPMSWLVKPARPISGLVTRKVHGITNADVADAPALAEIRAEVEALLAGRWMVAHNAHVEAELLARQLPNYQPAGILDTLRLARVLWPGRPSYGLDALIQQERLDPSAVTTSRRHRAAYDAWATAQLLLRLLDAAPATVASLRHLAELTLRPTAPTARKVDQAQQPSLWSPLDK
jgi:DNA polymerase III epsilon subunit-like protein